MCLRTASPAEPEKAILGLRAEELQKVWRANREVVQMAPTCQARLSRSIS